MKKIYLLFFVTGVMLGCNDFLDEKPRKGLVVPESLEQLSALLLKETESLQDPMWGEISSDDYYLNFTDLASKEESFRNSYSWSDNDVFGSDPVNDWLFHYRFIYYANTVLEKLSSIVPSPSDKAKWNRLMGEALFYRGKFHYDIAIIWADAYSKSVSSKSLGIPIRLSTNFNEKSVRRSLEYTYNQILIDIEKSIEYLPDESAHVTRPSKLAAKAMAARVHLSMGNFEKALNFASDVLKIKNKLLDFNELSRTAKYPISVFNEEVLLHAYMITSMNNIHVNTELWNSYIYSDIRKEIYFTNSTGGRVNFKGSYYGRGTLFSGLAVDELYLIVAECLVRLGREDEAKIYLGTLMQNRYVQGQLPVIDNLIGNELLDFVLVERRKELVFRGLRWGDVKRLNRTDKKVLLKRYDENGEVKSLPPNHPKFNLPIPQGIINLTGMEQNER